MEIDLSLLIAALGGKDADSRMVAAERLSQMGENARGAAVFLVKACADEDEEIREFVAAALEQLGPPDPGDGARLARLLGHEHPDVGYWAATLLGRLQAEAAPWVEELRGALETSPHEIVRERAAWALGKIGGRAASASEALERAADDGNERMTHVAEKALRRIRRG